MNIYDIANKANVSIATVSRVINNSGYVGEKTKQKVKKVIEENGYMPNVIAKNLSTKGSMKLIGIICYNIEDIYYAKAVAVLEKELRIYGYDIILSCTGISVKQKEKSIDMLLKKKVDAIIFIGSVFTLKGNKYLEKNARYVPMFIINGKIESKNVYSVYCNDYEAMKNNVSKMIEAGRKDILYVYDMDSYSGEMKYNGYLDGLQKYNLPLREEYVIKCDGSITDTEKVIKEFINSGKPINGILTANDTLAASCLNALRNYKKVPEEIAVIGYNNSFICECTYPKLTSTESNVEKLAIITAENINHYFNGIEIDKYNEITYQFIKRESF